MDFIIVVFLFYFGRMGVGGAVNAWAHKIIEN